MVSVEFSNGELRLGSEGFRGSFVGRKIKVQNLLTGETVDDSANVFITARGQLNDIKWPDIPGLDTFQGKMMHSGAWDQR